MSKHARLPLWSFVVLLGCSARGASGASAEGGVSVADVASANDHPSADVAASDAPDAAGADDAPPVTDAAPPPDAPAAIDVGLPRDALTDAGPSPVDLGADTGAASIDVGHDTGSPCPLGLRRCGDRCVDTASSRDHCGECDRACMGSASCVGGACVSAPTTRYQVLSDPPEVTYLDVCGTEGATRVLSLQDDARIRVALPFAFRYWSTDFAAGAPVNVTTNGWVSLSATTSFLRSSSIPVTLEPNATLAPYWRDIQVRGDGVCVTTLGASPNRRFVVEWKNALDVNNANTQLTFEVVLHETSNVIDIAYRTMTNAASATVGIENPAGTAAVSHCAADAGTWCRPTAGSRFRYVPIP